jgi:hypothetical protein
MTVHAHRVGAMLRRTRHGKRPRRHPWLAAVDGRAVFGMYFKTRAEPLAYAERVIALETAGGEKRPPASGKLGDRDDGPSFSWVPLGKWQ